MIFGLMQKVIAGVEDVDSSMEWALPQAGIPGHPVVFLVPRAR